MGLKILHSADWHMDTPFTIFSPEHREFLKQELKRVPGKIADLCLRENCDLVLLSGDIFDGAYTKESVAIVREALERCAVPVFIAPGNHDYVGAGSPWTDEPWPANVHIFTGDLSSVVIPKLDCRVYGAGYKSAESPSLLEDFRAGGMERYRVAVLHGDPLQLHSPYCPVTAAQVRDANLDYLALGHIHKAGSFRARGQLCGWPGVPMGRGYDETQEKGVYIIQLEDTATLRFTPLYTPRFYDVELNTQTQTPEDVLPAMGRQHFYRITLTGSGDESLDMLRRQLYAYPNVELIDHREQPLDPWERLDEDTLEGTYLRLLRAKMNVNDPETSEIIQMAAEISRMLIEGKEVVL